MATAQQNIDNMTSLKAIARKYQAIAQMRLEGAQRTADRDNIAFYSEEIAECKHHIAGLSRGIDELEEHLKRETNSGGGNGAAMANDPSNIGEFYELKKKLDDSFKKLPEHVQAAVIAASLRELAGGGGPF